MTAITTRDLPCTLPITKLRPPKVEDNVPPRLRLLNRLCAVRNKRLALVIAPVGSGKTTLLADCFRQLQADGVVTVWLSLDANERLLEDFVAHLLLALLHVLPEAAPATLKLLASKNSAPDAALNCLINDLAGAGRHITFFLDDFDTADNPATAGPLSYFLRYLPANVHLVLAGQRDFSQPLAWARARNWTIDLGWRDLCFDGAEVGTYFLEQHLLRLNESEIARLIQHTEGWPGAIRLAAEALASKVEETSNHRLETLFASNFAAPLLEEFFSYQPEELQAFLQQTAALDQLCPSLCDAVTASPDSHLKLKALECTHQLVQRGNGEWLRYPRLLSDFLCRRLISEAPEQFACLHRRAGDWFAARNMVSPALHHWLAAGADIEATRLLCSHGRSLLFNDDGRELQRCLDRLPATATNASTELSILRAWSALAASQPLAARAALTAARQARQLQNPGDTSPEAGEELLLQALCNFCRHDWPPSHHLEARLPQFFDETEPLPLTCARIVLGHTRRCCGDLSGAQAAYRDGADLAESHRLPVLVYSARHGQALIDLLQARPDRALSKLTRWLDGLGPCAEAHPRGVGLLHTLQAQALMDKGKTEEASAAINKAIMLLERSPVSGHLGLALVVRGSLHSDNGDIEAALTDLDRARASALPQQITRTLFRADLCEASLRLAEGALDETNALLGRAGRTLEESGQTSGENFEAWLAMRSAWLIARHRNSEAQDMALAGEAGARAAGRWRQVIDFLLLRAAALPIRSCGLAAGHDCIEEARKLAHPGGVCLPFRRMSATLDLFLHHADNERQITEAPLRLPDHLHQREEQILRLLEQGLRNREIAAKLFLSDETIKWYLKRLYGNFAVENRVQLIAVVRKLGLLGDALH